MSLVLHPQKNFTVVRQIANHLDTDTNYVQAVIRNAYTDAIIATLQLDDKGGQRFKKDWQVPADTSGEGFYVSIVTSVYTDSGYTSKNPNYGDEENTYLVEAAARVHGGGGVDAYTVRRIVSEELDKLPKPEPVTIPEPKDIKDRTDEILKAIKENKPEKVEKVDLKPVLTGVKELKAAIAAKEVTPKTDTYQLERSVETLKQSVETNGRKLLALAQDNPTEVVKLIEPAIIEKLGELVKDTTFTLAPTTAKMNPPQPKTQEPVPSPIDYKKLAI